MILSVPIPSAIVFVCIVAVAIAARFVMIDLDFELARPRCSSSIVAISMTTFLLIVCFFGDNYTLYRIP